MEITLLKIKHKHLLAWRYVVINVLKVLVFEIEKSLTITTALRGEIHTERHVSPYQKMKKGERKIIIEIQNIHCELFMIQNKKCNEIID